MRNAPANADPQSQRVVSLDALRGFDMFWIIGAEVIVKALAKGWHAKALGIASEQLEHKKWAGFAFNDLIFPLFVFIVGVSLVFSLTKLLSTGSVAAAVRRIVIRSALLFLLGVIGYGGFSKHYQDVRILGVLQRIALCYLCAGLLFCFCHPRVLACVAVSLLVAYWVLISFVPIPHQGHPSFAEGGNLANYIDAHYLPGHKYDGDHDPEGILSTIPAIASCLLGVFAGLLLQSGGVSPAGKVFYLLAIGALSVAIGTLWGLQFPVIKKLWTSSFVLVAGGYSAVLLGLFYLVIDVWRLQAWAKPFVWVGSNAITFYLLAELFNFRDFAARFIGGDLGHDVFGRYRELAVSVLAMGFILAMARFLYTRRIFLRV